LHFQKEVMILPKAENIAFLQPDQLAVQFQKLWTKHERHFHPRLHSADRRQNWRLLLRYKDLYLSIATILHKCPGNDHHSCELFSLQFDADFLLWNNIPDLPML